MQVFSHQCAEVQLLLAANPVKAATASMQAHALPAQSFPLSTPQSCFFSSGCDLSTPSGSLSRISHPCSAFVPYHSRLAPAPTAAKPSTIPTSLLEGRFLHSNEHFGCQASTSSPGGAHEGRKDASEAQATEAGAVTVPTPPMRGPKGKFAAHLEASLPDSMLGSGVARLHQGSADQPAAQAWAGSHHGLSSNARDSKVDVQFSAHHMTALGHKRSMPHQNASSKDPAAGTTSSHSKHHWGSRDKQEAGKKPKPDSGQPCIAAAAHVSPSADGAEMSFKQHSATQVKQIVHAEISDSSSNAMCQARLRTQSQEGHADLTPELPRCDSSHWAQSARRSAPSMRPLHALPTVSASEMVKPAQSLQPADSPQSAMQGRLHESSHPDASSAGLLSPYPSAQQPQTGPFQGRHLPSVVGQARSASPTQGFNAHSSGGMSEQRASPLQVDSQETSLATNAEQSAGEPSDKARLRSVDLGHVPTAVQQIQLRAARLCKQQASSPATASQDYLDRLSTKRRLSDESEITGLGQANPSAVAAASPESSNNMTSQRMQLSRSLEFTSRAPAGLDLRPQRSNQLQHLQPCRSPWAQGYHMALPGRGLDPDCPGQGHIPSSTHPSWSSQQAQGSCPPALQYRNSLWPPSKGLNAVLASEIELQEGILGTHLQKLQQHECRQVGPGSNSSLGAQLQNLEQQECKRDAQERPSLDDVAAAANRVTGGGAPSTEGPPTCQVLACPGDLTANRA